MPTKDIEFQTLSKDEIKALRANFDMRFGYQTLSGRIAYNHAIYDKKTHFSVVVDMDLPDDFVKLNRFRKFVNEDGSSSYGLFVVIDGDDVLILNDKDAFFATNMKSAVNHLKNTQENFKKYETLKLEHEQRMLAIKGPKEGVEISVEELASKFSSKKTYFFTGAGLSAPVINDWNGLMNQMGFSQNRSDEENLRATFESVKTDEGLKSLMQNLHKTHESFIFSEPTKGHLAIAEISKNFNRCVFTDNRDLVHQNSGVAAIHVEQIKRFRERPWQKEVEIDPKEIDCLVVCGMGGDRRGFIEWAKKNNPALEVINLNLENQLGKYTKVDGFVNGDLQEILPSLEKVVKAPKGAIVEDVKASKLDGVKIGFEKN